MTRNNTYSTNEAAELLGIAPRTVVRWIESGVIKAEKMNPLTRNSPLRIEKSEVERILELRKKSSRKSSWAL